jgi:uncharacterized protein YbaP (TraB family)
MLSHHTLLLLYLLLPLSYSSYLWKIDLDPPSFLFGTIHLPYRMVWSDKSGAAEAFAKSTHVYLEMIKEEETEEDCENLPGNQTLDLPAEMAVRLDELLPRNTWQRLRPMWLAVTLSYTLLDTSGAGSEDPILDDFLGREAVRAGKRLSALETDAEQCGIFHGIDPDLAVFFLNKTLQAIENATSTIYSYTAWAEEYLHEQVPVETLIDRDLDYSAEERKMVAKVNAYYNENLVLARNRRMAGKILETLKASPSESYFIAVGVGHLTGPRESIVQLVRAAGYKVEQVISSSAAAVAPLVWLSLLSTLCLY